MTAIELTVLGLSLNIAGTIVLTFSLAGYLRALHLATLAHELYLLGLGHPRLPLVHFTGTDQHVDRGRRRATWLSLLGVCMVISGFILQMWVLLRPVSATQELALP